VSHDFYGSDLKQNDLQWRSIFLCVGGILCLLSRGNCGNVGVECQQSNEDLSSRIHENETHPIVPYRWFSKGRVSWSFLMVVSFRMRGEIHARIDSV